MEDKGGLKMNLTDFEKDVIDRLGRIETKLDNDFRAIHGNGQPGLLQRVSKLEEQQKLMTSRQGWLKEAIAWLVATAIAIYAAFFKD